MKAADIADLLKTVAKDVRELLAKSLVKFEERFAAIEQRLQDAPEQVTAEKLAEIFNKEIGEALTLPIGMRIDQVIERLVAVEERALVPGLPGDKGEPGDRGVDGKDIDEAALELRIAAAVEKAVATAMAAVVLPKDGKDGVDGKDGQDGQDGQDGTDGKSVDDADLQARIDAAASKAATAAVAEIPMPRDGVDGKDGTDGQDGKDVDDSALQVRVNAAVEKAASAIPAPKDGVDGKDGQDGRDAFQIDVLDDIDVERSYPRGTCARWRGGVIRAFRATDPTVEGVPIEKLGWSCFIDGVHEIAPEATGDPRVFKLRASTTSGKVREFEVHLPATIYRNVWTDREYEEGDLVTYGGSVWHCDRPTKAKPGTQTKAPDWTLCVKRGRDGKDGDKGLKGDKGDDGRPGRDLTQLGFDGSKT